MFCRGLYCNRCGPTAYLHCESPAFTELHSNWITNDVAAMARPTNLNSALIADMLRQGVSAVFNLTMAGEHPYCGRRDGRLELCGFSYDPETLMAHNIKHFNFSWPDMTIPTLHQALHIAQIAMSEIAAGGKVAIHCHAGYGRTGIAIACILIAKDGLNAKEAISCIRNRRPGSVQTTAQVDFVFQFERFYAQLLNTYDTPQLYSTLNIRISPKTISESVHDQEFTLLASEKETYRNVHKSVDILQRILINCYTHSLEDVFHGISGMAFKHFTHNRCYESLLADSRMENLLYSMKVAANKGEWSSWTLILERSALPSEAESAGLSGAISKSDIGLNILLDGPTALTPLVQYEVVVATQLMLDWIIDRAEPLLGARVLHSASKILNTFAGNTFSALESTDYIWTEIRDLREVPRSLSADKVLLQLDECLTASLSR